MCDKNSVAYLTFSNILENAKNTSFALAFWILYDMFQNSDHTNIMPCNVLIQRENRDTGM